MSEELSLVHFNNARFRTTRAADELNQRFLTRLGVKYRYAPARLAISRSLADSTAPPQVMDDEPGKVIKGEELFGNDLPTWISLVTQHRGGQIGSVKEFHALVAGHWHRGIHMLWEDWQNQQEDFDRFLFLLATRAGIREGKSGKFAGEFGPVETPQRAFPVSVRIGDPGTDLVSKKPVDWISNAAGYPPHAAIMGGTNSGKTHLGLSMLRQIKKQTNCPIILFDIAKGDLAEKRELIEPLGLNSLVVPNDPVPLNFLAVNQHDAEDATQVALSFRESFGRVERIGAVQKDILRDAAIEALAGQPPVLLQNVRDAVNRVCEERNVRGGTLLSVLNDLCAGRSLFFPQLSPAEFFARSWLIDLHHATETQQRLVVFLVLDAAKRYFMSLPDAVTDSNGSRTYRGIIAIDEARRVLGYKHPSLSNLIRLVRSKGVGIWLMSQSPDDFDQEEDNFLENIGVAISFRTYAMKVKTLRTILGADVDLASLPAGVAVTRLPGRTSYVRVQAWEPPTQ
jgi:DNA sulfur modification protein DndE